MTPIIGLLPGRVVATDDPDQGGRIRVRVEQVYGDPTNESEYIPDERLPWARAAFIGAGDGVGDFFVPPVGSQVWVSFWQGERTKPIWHGGWGVPSTVPAEFKSSYAPTPQARVIRTEGGQLMQFRWKKGEERFEVLMPSGTRLLIDDTTAAGPKIAATLPSGRRIVADDKLNRIEAADATGQSVIIDGAGQKIMVTTPGEVDVTAGGNVIAAVGGNLLATVVGIVSVICATLNVTSAGVINLIAGGAVSITAAGALLLQAAGITQTSTGPGATVATGGGVENRTFVGAATWSYLSWALAAAATIALTAATGMTITAAAGVLALVGSNITLGAALATKQRLLDERFITGAGGYNTHTHGGVAIDTPIVTNAIPNFATTHTKAS
jgi:hypothetical protein